MGSLKQFTAKRVVEVLHWLHNNPHHIVGLEQPKETHVFYQNYHEKMRVPTELLKEASKYIKANPRKFDTRMFAITPAGRKLIGL